MSNRITQPGGPAHAVWNSKTLQPRKEWQLSPQLKVTALSTGLYGVVGDIEDHPHAEIQIQPIAFTSGLAALLAILFPYQTPKHGALLFPSTDLPLLIKTDEGAASKTLTFPAAAITKPPTLQYAAGKPFFGDMTMTMLRANNAVATTAGSFSSAATLTYSAPGYDPTGEVDSTYVYAWGGVAPFDSFETDPEGVRLEVSYGWDELPEANHGVRQFRLKSVSAQARFVPTSVTAEDFLAALAMVAVTTFPSLTGGAIPSGGGGPGGGGGEVEEGVRRIDGRAGGVGVVGGEGVVAAVELVELAGGPRDGRAGGREARPAREEHGEPIDQVLDLGQPRAGLGAGGHVRRPRELRSRSPPTAASRRPTPPAPTPIDTSGEPLVSTDVDMSGAWPV